MSSPKRHVLISLLFILKCFSKSLVIKEKKCTKIKLEGPPPPLVANRPIPSCFEPHYKSEAKCKAFHVKISFIIMINNNKPNLYSAKIIKYSKALYST